MGFRFRKSISIIPGVRVNLSNGAPSLSIGPRGASLSVGKNGTFANLGLPGTGLSYRTRIDRTARERVNTRHQADPGLRSELELVVEKLMSTVTAITNIHELSPSPKGGNTWATLETQYLALRQGSFTLPAPVRPNKPEYIHFHQNLMSMPVAGSLGDGLNLMQPDRSDRTKIFGGGRRPSLILNVKMRC